VVDYELEDGTTSSISVSETDIPLLCDDDFEKAKGYLGLVLSARSGDQNATRNLALQEHPRTASGRVQPSESSFVVPSISHTAHSEQEISQKASILLKLSQQGYPVPDFVVLTSQGYLDRAQHPEQHVSDAVRQLEILTMQSLGDCKNPLVFAMRCATTHYIPGVMDTYLNVGVTESTLPSLEKMYGSVAARKMYLNNLRNLCHALHHDEYLAILRTVKSDLAPDEVARLIDQLAEIIRQTDRKLVENPLDQTILFATQAYKHFEENRELVLTLCRGTEHYPSLIMQKMICTVRHESAYAGVISSRHTHTGTGIELQTAHNIFGEEMMTGTAEIQSTSFEDREAIKSTFPAIYHFVPHLAELESEFESPVTIEFAVEATGRHQFFALLQLNQTGMSGRAAITSAVDMHKAGTISRQRVTELVRPYHLKQLTSDTIDQDDFRLLNTFCSGIAVLPRSAVSGRVYFTGDAALRAKSEGQKVCLCQQTFLPTDTVVMREMDAIISLTSAAVHVVTICQSLGIPALLSLEKNGVSLKPGVCLVNSSGKEIKEGDWITISSRRRSIYHGQAKFKPARLLRYMKGEPVEMDENDKKAFASIAYAYRYYQQLTRGLEAEQISTLSEVTRLVNFELRGECEEAKQLVNGWFDERERVYMEEVLKSDIGDHLGQSNVFEMLTLERKIRFFKQALERCSRERISGYEAGAFMLGRFLCGYFPASFWKRFTPSEIGLLVNEWVLFEKYMQLLHNVGERKILLARKQILKRGLDQLSLHPGNVQCLITLKLSAVNLDECKASLPEWADPQSGRVLELLQQPYRVFYDFNAPWSVGQLDKICREEDLPLPRPDDC
jgi:phosphohistidine swiveling domain-containing protein